jgi:hypothetical protein
MFNKDLIGLELSPPSVPQTLLVTEANFDRQFRESEFWIVLPKHIFCFCEGVARNSHLDELTEWHGRRGTRGGEKLAVANNRDPKSTMPDPLRTRARPPRIERFRRVE